MSSELRKNFKEFYENSYAKIYVYTFRLVRNSEEANQLTQLTFTRMYDYLLSKRKVINPTAFAYRIASNICFDYLRRENKFKKVEKEIYPSENPQHSFSEDNIRTAQKTLVSHAMQKLQPRDQICLLLYKEGFSHADIAATIKENKSAIGKIISRATTKIIKEIKNGDKL